MRLHLLRHGEALPDPSNDKARVLSPKGEEDIQKLGEYLKTHRVRFDSVYASPYKRTQQTAEILDDILKFPFSFVVDKFLVPEVISKELIEKLAMLDAKSILLVTHQPLISRFMGAVLDNNAGLSYNYPMEPASYAVIDMTAMALGCGLLRSVVHPESL